MEDDDARPPASGTERRLRARGVLWRAARPWLAGALGIAAGIFVLARLDNSGAPAQPADVRPAVASAVATALSRPAISAEVYQAILPSLVYVTTGEQGEGGTLGTGVIVNEDGSILTAYHVVEGAQRISVVFADGTRASAEIATADPEHDLAVLHADHGPEVLVPAVLASGQIRVGDEAYAAGNPLGLVASLTAGVISGLDRELTTPGGGKLTGLIQFDAAVNPGSSGGPLLNRHGQVVGIVTALANPSNEDSFMGIGFAVPLGSGGGAGGGPPR